MAYYRECPACGAHLDPGERCTECADRAKEHGAERAGASAEKVTLAWKHTPVKAPGMIRKIFPYG